MKIDLLILLFSLTSLLGDAQNLKYGQAFPKMNGTISVSVVHDNRPRMQLAVHAKRATKSSFVFWLDFERDRDVRKKVKDEWGHDSVFLKVNLDSIVTTIVKEKIQHPLNYAANYPSKNILRVMPHATIILEENNYHLGYQIECSFLDESGTLVWQGQYAYAVPDAKPLFGRNSLTANNGELLRSWALRGFSKCIETLFVDLTEPSKWKNDMNLPKELEGVPGKSLRSRGLAVGTIILQETSDDWITKQPTGRKNYFTIIVSKDPERLLPHPIESNSK